MEEGSTYNKDEEELGLYLNSFLEDRKVFPIPRKKCCGTSRSLYCTECCKLLVEKREWPTSIQKGRLELPFDLDIVLDDRRNSATGFHALVLCNESQSVKEECQKVRLFDIEREDTLPNYEDEENTFILFPSSDSIPITAVAHSIKRLVVMDCKWTKSSSKNLPQLQNLQKVHLTNPPEESFFWRWHNAGKGMISTIEAIYFASLEVAKSNNKLYEDNIENLIDIMWLFGIQRSTTAISAIRDGKPSPFSKDGKTLQRDLRKTEKGSEKHLRDIAMGKKLKENLRQNKESR